MKQEFSPYFVIYMDLSLGFVTWICLNLNWLLAVTGVMHEADDAYSIRSTWSCYWLDQFLKLALNILILSIFYISMDLSTNYFAHFSGCWASFACSCHYPRMLCHVFWSKVDKIVCFITSFRWLWMILAHSTHSFWSICLILMINFASFESFSWFILVHLDHFGDQLLSILLQFGTFWWLF